MSRTTRPAVSRRSLLRVSGIGLAGVAMGLQSPMGRALLGAVGTTTAHAEGALQLTMRECLVEMVDERRVYMWAFDSPQAGLRVPGPVIYATDGAPVVIDVTNALARPHAFSVEGVVDSGPIEPGETVRVHFTAPSAGTYVYHDPLRAPLHRAMGLAGMLVVLSNDDGNTPYSDPTAQVQNLFDDLGTTTYFPGQAWRPERTWLWALSSVDHVMHERVATDPDLSPEAFLADYLPTYFLVNGRSGYFASKDPATALHGRVGQPALLRIANLGMATHSPHIHGNHVHVLAEAGTCRDNLLELDTWTVWPQHTVDVLLPFARPPDAWPWPPSDPSVFTTDLAGDGSRGMVYPIHGHIELDQMANGGNYPQGMVSHWVLEGDLVTDEPDEPVQPDEPDPAPTESASAPDDPDEPDQPDQPDEPDEPDPDPTESASPSRDSAAPPTTTPDRRRRRRDDRLDRWTARWRGTRRRREERP